MVQLRRAKQLPSHSGRVIRVFHGGLAMSDNHAALVEPLVIGAQRALACLNGNLGQQFILSARLSQKSSTWAVDAPEGGQGVLKVYEDSHCATVEQTMRLAEHLWAAGYPTPRPLRHGAIPGGGCYYLHERLPGQPMRSPGFYAEMNQHELGLLLPLFDLHAGIAPVAAQDWTDKVAEIALQQQGEWAVVARSPLPAVQSLLATCAQRCTGLGDPGLRHSDLVIGDFGPHNILLNDQGRVAAVFDLDGGGRGDRVIDMVGLFYMVELHLLHDVRRAVFHIATPAALTACGVYWIVRRLHQGIMVNDENLNPVAQQMLAYVDLLI